MKHRKNRRKRHFPAKYRPKPTRGIPEGACGPVDDADRFLGRPYVGKREDSAAFARELL